MMHQTINFARRLAATRFPAVVAAALILGAMLMAGCGTPPLPPPDAPDDGTLNDPDGGSDPASVTFQFDEDADPLVASLPFVEDELLAKVLPGATAEDLQEAYSEADVTQRATIDAIQMVAVGVDAAKLDAAAAALSSHPAIESVHKSYVYEAEASPNDPEFRRQSHLEDIGAIDAWEITTGDPDMIIAVLDTGVELDHPDLADKLVEGWNIYDDNENFDDVLGHGTSVAGAAAAISDNGEGVAGVSWENPIMPIRVSSSRGNASSRNLATGIVWAVDHGAKIINASFAPLGSDSTVLAAAGYARASGALVFISAGNSGKFYSAAATDDAIFVGALDTTGALASFSDTGAFVDLAAPGTAIQTTAVEGGYRRVNGTSFASPITAGVAALVWSVNPEFRPTTVETLLFETAVDLGDEDTDSEFGHGAVDAFAAVEAALNVVEEKDTKAPSVQIVSPANMAVVSGYAQVSVGAFDAVGLADVVLYLDDEPFATDTSKPFRFTVNTSRLTEGLHTLTVVATDSSGNASGPAEVRIRVVGGSSGGNGNDNSSGDGGGNTAGTDDQGPDLIDPLVEVISPVDGSGVVESVAIQAVVSDNRALRQVEWLIDGVLQRSDPVGGVEQLATFVWNASRAATGPHRITIRVQDAARNEALATLTLVKE